MISNHAFGKAIVRNIHLIQQKTKRFYNSILLIRIAIDSNKANVYYHNRIQLWSFQLYDDWHFVYSEHLSFPNASSLHSNIIHSIPFHSIQYKYRNRVLWWLIEMNINQNTANDSSFRLESVHFLLLSCFIHQSLIF